MKIVPFLGFLLSLVSSAHSDCFSSAPSWKTADGNLLLNDGRVFHMKGTSWFGFETETYAPHGLWSKSISFFLDFLQTHNFNALRVPFSVKMAFENPSTNVDCGSNPSVCNLKALDLMEHIVEEAGKRGILVMLDQHRLYGNGIHELWYDSKYPEDKILESWDIMMTRFATKWNVFIIDVKNEPHGAATWGYGVKATDWNKAAERIIAHIGAKFPQYKGLFMVEGVGENAKTTTPNSYGHFWAENLEGLHQYPIRTGDSSLDERVVYSPHVYGPDVYNQEYFKVGNFPQNMPEIWDLHFGFGEAKTGHALVVGEWGGHYKAGTKDRVWQDAFGAYLKQKCMADQFYWCLNPNSGDTGGLLNDDWNTANDDKLKLLESVQPNPSKLTKSGSQYCFEAGQSVCGDQGSSSSKATTKATTTTSITTRSTTRQSTTKATTTTQKSTTSSTKSPSPDGKLTISTEITGSWQQGGQAVTKIELLVTNGGSSKVCGATIRIKPSDTQILTKWNLEDTSNSGEFDFPSWLQLEPGKSYYDIGMAVFSSEKPEFEVVNTNHCGLL